MPAPSTALSTVTLPSRPTAIAAVPGSLTGRIQQTGNELALQFQETLADLVASYGRLPVSAAVLILAAVAGALVVPGLVRAFRSIGDRQPLDTRTGALGETVRWIIPTTFSELLVRVVQLTIAIVAALALVVVWGYADLVTDVRRSIATDAADVIGLSLTLLLIALAFVGSDLLQRAIDRLGEEASGVTEHQQEIALRVGQVTLFVTVGAAIMTLWSFNLSGLLVGAGFLGIVVGFAARKTLGSLISGFMLMFSRPFTVGDWVAIGEAEGVVTDITMFNTRIQNVDAELQVIPNDVVSDSTIVNRSRKGRLRIRREVGIDYDNDPEVAVDVAVEAMERVDGVLDSPGPQAVPVRFGDSSIVLELRFWIADPRPSRKWDAVAGVMGEVKSAFDANGIEIPYPQRTVSQRGSTVGKDMADDGNHVVEPSVDGSRSDEPMGNGE